jgi:hypothetical protein
VKKKRQVPFFLIQAMWVIQPLPTTKHSTDTFFAYQAIWCRTGKMRQKKKRKWNWESEMQLYEGPNPWGPWSIFHNEKQWGGKDHTAYLPQMPSPWISKDGLSGSILFAGDYVNRKQNIMDL